MNKAERITPVQEGNFAYLDLLARVKKALDSARDIRVSATDIRPFPNQPRKYFDEKHIRGLAESIDAGGQTTPGMIREKTGPTRYELIDGECRWRGVLRIPESRRPLYKASLIEAEDDVVQYLISGIANFNRKGHTAIETMHTIEQLVVFKLPMSEIANLLGISTLWAEQMYGLRKLVPQVQQMLDPRLPKEKQLAVLAAIQISKADPRLQFMLAERVIKKIIPLTQLRSEVVRISKEAGAEIRTRQVEPRKEFESFQNRLNILLREAGTLEAALKQGRINRFVTASAATSVLIEKVKKAQNTLKSVENLIRQARSIV
jgi:ParB family chromosome partitioning protein